LKSNVKIQSNSQALSFFCSTAFSFENILATSFCASS
jgi:hypothetical protein